MRRNLLLLPLLAAVFLGLAGCASGTKPSASATVILPCPTPPPSMLEPVEPDKPLVPGYLRAR